MNDNTFSNKTYFLKTGSRFFSAFFLAGSSLLYTGLVEASVFWKSSLPKSTDPTVHILHNKGYITGYSECRRSALWVSYPLSKKKYFKWPKRRQPFCEDERTQSNLSPDDYWYSGYDRGHLAPGYGVWSVSGPAARSETYLMSNIVPQKKRLNQKLWQRLEEVATTYFTRYFKDITVYTGPVYMDKKFTDSGVRIPTALYKIFVAEKDNKLFSLSFIMPQTVKGKESLDHFVTNIDEVEQVTGLDFLADLDDVKENKLEAEIDNKSWNLKALSNLPGRY